MPVGTLQKRIAANPTAAAKRGTNRASGRLPRVGETADLASAAQNVAMQWLMNRPGSVVSPEGWKTTNCADNACVEVALLDAGIAVRDSKDREGPMLVYTVAEWEAFLDGVKKGEFEVSQLSFLKKSAKPRKRKKASQRSVDPMLSL